ncbi:ribonuclease J [Pikeienuella sp. HZG-20]|uniref:ribonuclease J n=1 Tax=Paludibacillus litoralis TaxID=3133267 RepID=UPI0030ECD215
MADNAKLVYVALGGAGEIGMNMYLYGHGPAKSRRWIMVDCGVSFGDMDTSPGIDLVMPDISFVEEIQDRLEAVFITHAHEDHVGALGRLWPKIRAPFISAPLFTAEVARRKMAECGQPAQVVKTAKWDEPVEAGPFRVSFLRVTHSIPDPAMLLIETPAGKLVHTGDFKLDPDPIIGKPTDMARLKQIGDDGLLGLMCDSTNIFEDGESGGEQPLRPHLKRLIKGAKGAVAATTFASNVGRLKTLAEVAVECGRSVVVAGRAMQRMIETATETGALKGFPPTISDERARDVPAENLFYLVTGSQGEGRAALARIATGSHPMVKLKKGDLVLFSSKTIPGNEKEVYRLYNLLSEQGVEVVDDDMEPIHVSGHGRRDEIGKVYAALRPRVAAPIHGEHRHLAEHAELAKGWGAKSIVAPNGTMVGLDLDPPRVLRHVETGRVYLDGEVLVGALDGVIRARLKMARQGHVSVSLVIDESGELFADPLVRVEGAPEVGRGGQNIADTIADRVDAAIVSASKKELRSDDRVAAMAERVARRAAMEVWGKKPVTCVLVTRLESEG